MTPTIEQIKMDIMSKGTFDVIARGMWRRFLIERASGFYWDEPQRADGVPILARADIGPQILNHKLHTPFDRTIVNTKTAYFASNVAVVFEEGFPKDVAEFYKKTQFSSDISSVFEELATYASDSGTSYALFTKSGLDVNITAIEPWQCLVKHNPYTKKPEYGVIYSRDEVRVYDGINVTAYAVIPPKAGAKNREVTYDRLTVEPHGFGTAMRPGIPLVEFPNNPNRMGNAVMTVSLQDAFDTSLSDLSSEIGQTRLAYLLMKGLGQDDEKLLEQMQKSGIILVDDKDGDAKFVTKDLKPQAVELLQKTLRLLIFEGANSYDPASFAEGKTPPTAYEVNERLHPLEMDVQTTIKAWDRALKYTDYLVQTFLMTWLRVDEYDLFGISRIFRRVAPRNTIGLLVEARQAGMVLSNGTMVELSGLQIDPVEEALRIDAEGIVRRDLDRRVAEEGKAIEADATEPSAEPDPTVSVEAGAVGEDNNIVSLNGAQVTSATEIVKSVGTGELTIESAENMLQILFNLTVEQSKQMVSGMTPAEKEPVPEALMNNENESDPSEG